MFDLVGTRDLHAMTYCEFLDGICTFGMFKQDDMIKFVFFVLDKDGGGLIPRKRLLRFVESLHGKKILAFERAILPDDVNNDARNNNAPSVRKSKPPGNDARLLPAAERRRISVDHAALTKLCIDYPTLLEPMMRLQNTIRRRIMGDSWWRRKEKQISRYELSSLIFC